MPNRTLCDVLREMRELDRTKNFASLAGLIEEAQTMANRMEAKLFDQKDFEYAKKEYSKLSKKIKTMKAKVEDEDT